MGEPETDSELLSIKEAAAFLKVSEASLRRWTNTGKLNCSRLGLKRERRFRRDDLRAFLDTRSSSADSSGNSPIQAQQTRVHLEGVAIEYASHICTLYDNDFGRLKWSVPFLLDGLKQGECCFLVAAPNTQYEILEHVKKGWDGVEKAMKTGQLILTNGLPDGDAMCRFVEQSIFEATRNEFRSFRLLGDMSWCLELGMTQDQLFEYEQRFNREIGHSFPLVSVCQYDTRDFNGPAVLNALKCHEDTFNFPLSRFLST